jgi:hypothetical protein
LRGYARAYEDFKDLSDYRQREISDITYTDEAGEFTRWLINHGYAQAESWLEKPPRYLIEVKTTTGACSERFFMSNHQAKLVSFHDSFLRSSSLTRSINRRKAWLFQPAMSSPRMSTSYSESLTSRPRQRSMSTWIRGLCFRGKRFSCVRKRFPLLLHRETRG